MDQSGLFTADESTGTVAELDVKIEARAEDVFTEQAIFASLSDGDLQTVDSQRVFSTDINQTVGSTDGIAADGHSLDDAVRVTFHDGTVHERTRVAFVGVADDVHLIALVLCAEAPFHAGGETSAATATEA